MIIGREFYEIDAELGDAAEALLSPERDLADVDSECEGGWDDVRTALRAVEAARALLDFARAILAPTVKDEREAADHHADLADAQSY